MDQKIIEEFAKVVSHSVAKESINKLIAFATLYGVLGAMIFFAGMMTISPIKTAFMVTGLIIAAGSFFVAISIDTIFRRRLIAHYIKTGTKRRIRHYTKDFANYERDTP